MTPETFPAASSKSPSVLAPLGALGLGAAILAVILAAAAGADQIPERASRSYDNPAGRKILADNSGKKLTVAEQDRKISLKTAELDSWKTNDPADFKTAAGTSLVNYFFAQVRASHPWSAYDSGSRIKGYRFAEDRIGEFVLGKAGRLNRPAANAELVIKDGRAVRFRAEQSGYTLDEAAALSGLKQSLASAAEEFTLPLAVNSPKIKLADLNSLGINERIARGQSDFTGSTAPRIQNIRVGSSQFNGLIIKPGEEFSFNTALGAITEAKGYLPELVIKSEGTTKELGGGLCQVSSTMFRAAFFGGLPITARRNHSYAVAYYTWIADGQPRAAGLDATIYPGAQDMKFINDTPGHILIWTSIEGKRLYFDFYGAKDDRQVSVDGPHEYSRQSTGAVKARVTRRVSKNGSSEEKTFTSSYVSPNLYPKLYELPPAPIVSETPPPDAPSLPPAAPPTAPPVL